MKIRYIYVSFSKQRFMTKSQLKISNATPLHWNNNLSVQTKTRLTLRHKDTRGKLTHKPAYSFQLGNIQHVTTLCGLHRLQPFPPPHQTRLLIIPLIHLRYQTSWSASFREACQLSESPKGTTRK